jgi:tetratricopeptide (TPR) repeat protein
VAEELAERSRAGVNLRSLSSVLTHVGLTFLEWGQRQRTEQIWAEHQELAERSGQAYCLIAWMFDDAVRATLDGRLEDAVAIAHRIQGLVEQRGLRTNWHLVAASLMLLLHLGEADEALQLNRQHSHLRWFYQVRALCLAQLGQDAEVAEILEQLVLGRPGIGSPEDETPGHEDILLLEAAVLVGHRPAADLLMRRWVGSGVRTMSFFFTTCIARHLAAAAALLGRPEEARAHYQTALELANEVRSRPEVALTRLQLAELLLEHYPDERAEALEHLDFAIAEFRDMKMQPSLERALRHKDILKA